VNRRESVVVRVPLERAVGCVLDREDGLGATLRVQLGAVLQPVKGCRTLEDVVDCLAALGEILLERGCDDVVEIGVWDKPSILSRLLSLSGVIRQIGLSLRVNFRFRFDHPQKVITRITDQPSDSVRVVIVVYHKSLWHLAAHFTQPPSALNHL